MQATLNVGNNQSALTGSVYVHVPALNHDSSLFNLYQDGDHVQFEYGPLYASFWISDGKLCINRTGSQKYYCRRLLTVNFPIIYSSADVRRMIINSLEYLYRHKFLSKSHRILNVNRLV